jgi:hypothetical protein
MKRAAVCASELLAIDILCLSRTLYFIFHGHDMPSRLEHISVTGKLSCIFHHY